MADIPGITATKKIFLTGTPIQNRPRELWPLIRYLDPITWSSWWKFASRYCNASQGNHWDSSGASNLGELQQILRRTIMIRRMKKDVLPELPPKTRKVIEIPPDGAARVALRAELEALDTDAIADLQVKVELAKAGDSKQVYEERVAELSGRIRRADEDLFTLRKNTAIAKARMPAVMEMLGEAVEASGKVIIFLHHKEVCRLIAEKFGSSAAMIVGDVPLPERDKAASRFQNDPSCKVIIGSFGSMGVGWTLTAGSHVICFELDWVPGNVSQAEDRAHRIGQTDNVLVEHYVLENSLDADMARTIVEKQEVIAQALDPQEAELESKAPTFNGSVSVTFSALAKEAALLTPDQRAAAQIAIRMLAGSCDGAGNRDGQGFNKVHAAIGRRLAEMPGLTPKQCALARKICMTYARTQLPAEIVARL